MIYQIPWIHYIHLITDPFGKNSIKLKRLIFKYVMVLCKPSDSFLSLPTKNQYTFC